MWPFFIPFFLINLLCYFQLNPWPIIGGVATSVCSEDEFINPIHLEIGDVVVLTKPLGTQPAVNAHQWKCLENQFWDRIKNIITPEEGK